MHLRKGDEGYPVPGIDPGFDVHVKKVQVLNLHKADSLEFLQLVPVYVPNTEHLAGYNLDISNLSGPEEEFYEGFFLVDFLPTSENLCKWIYECAQVKMARLGIKVQRVEWNETPKSRSTYFGS